VNSRCVAAYPDIIRSRRCTAIGRRLRESDRDFVPLSSDIQPLKLFEPNESTRSGKLARRGGKPPLSRGLRVKLEEMPRARISRAFGVKKPVADNLYDMALGARALEKHLSVPRRGEHAA